MKEKETNQKEIKVFSFMKNNTERNRRNRKARAYSESVAKRKAKAKKTRRMEIGFNVGMIVAILLLVGGMFAKALTTENSYYKRTSERQPNGNYYVYVTERICEVVEINNDLITVEYKGDLYDFFGDGYTVGDKIVCQFTKGMEIVGVTE